MKYILFLVFLLPALAHSQDDKYSRERKQHPVHTAQPHADTILYRARILDNLTHQTSYALVYLHRKRWYMYIDSSYRFLDKKRYSVTDTILYHQ